MRDERSIALRDLIAVARECKGWTLRELEQASGVSNALISQIETGKVKDPGFSTVVRIVDALGITLDRAASAERAKLNVLRTRAPWCAANHHKYVGKCPYCHTPLSGLPARPRENDDIDERGKGYKGYFFYEDK